MLTSRINAARTAVGDSGRKLIRTIPRKGLRFMGALHAQVDDNQPAQATDPPSGRNPRRVAASVAAARPTRHCNASLHHMSGDQEQQYFSDGISEDIITAPSKLRWFFVIARNSSFIYKGKAAP